MSKRTVTITFEFSDYFLSDLQQMKRDGALDAVAECLATLEGRPVLGVHFSD